METNTNLNIICLHGFTQNSHILKKKLSKITKSIKNVNWYFCQGSVILEPTEAKLNSSNYTGCSSAYWVYDLQKPLEVDWSHHHKDTNKTYFLEESYESFIELCFHIGRVDGILGFSQGGCFADYICKTYVSAQVSYLKFAIFIASQPFNRLVCPFDGIHPDLKTLHIYGNEDSVIPKEQSEKLVADYPNHTVLNHKGAHVIPSNSEFKNLLKNFLAQF